MGFFSAVTDLVKDFASPVSAIISGGASLLGGSLANAASAKSVDKQMAFQEEMSNTSYQRAVKDMVAAGINPMLAYQQGGASTPTGGSYTAQDVLTPAVHSAQQASRLGNETSLARANTELVKGQAYLTGAQTAKVMSDVQTNVTQRQLNSALAAKASAETALAKASLPRKDTEGKIYSAVGDAVGTVKKYLTPAASSVKSFLDSHPLPAGILQPPHLK